MQATVIDTLRYANRLKDAGVDGRQAEAMALAISDELVSGLATKDDLNNAVGELRGELGELRGQMDSAVAGLRGELGELRGQMDSAVAGLRGELGELRGQMDSAVAGLRGDLDSAVGGLRGDLDSAVGGLRGDLDSAVGGLRGELGELRAELGALNGKFETHGRHVFLVLALIAALGLFNAVAPHFGRTLPTANPPADVSAPPPTSTSSSAHQRLEPRGRDY